VQFPADRVFGERLAGTTQHLLLQEGDRPIVREVAPLVRRGLQQGLQHSDSVLRPQRRAADAILVDQVSDLPLLAEAVDPVVDALTADVQVPSHFLHGPSLIDFEDCQQAPIQAGIAGAAELLSQLATFIRSQVELAHGVPPPAGYQEQAPKSKTFCGPA
jgi:hypothetical protein